MNHHRATTPIYDGTRMFLGRRDLVISFYTRKCQFRCTFCALPQRSAADTVSRADLSAQIAGVFAAHRRELGGFRQLSFGNEGSALDPQRFHPESLRLLLDSAARLMPNLEVASVETRPEYISEARLADVKARLPGVTVDMTVGFETQDDKIRLQTLNKKISRRLMEDRIALLGALGVRLTSYVMVKPAPGMSEDDGVSEASATIEYLAGQCARHGTELVVYLTPLYIAEGSELARTRGRDWTPPAIQSVLRVILAGHRLGVPVYTGLWSEGMAAGPGDYTARDGYDPEVRAAILLLNKTGSPAAVEPFALSAAGART